MVYSLHLLHGIHQQFTWLSLLPPRHPQHADTFLPSPPAPLSLDCGQQPCRESSLSDVSLQPGSCCRQGALLLPPLQSNFRHSDVYAGGATGTDALLHEEKKKTLSFLLKYLNSIDISFCLSTRPHASPSISQCLLPLAVVFLPQLTSPFPLSTFPPLFPRRPPFFPTSCLFLSLA